MIAKNAIIHLQLNISRPNPFGFPKDMVANRDEHKEPVIMAFVALPGETLVEVTARCLPGSGLFVPKTREQNRDEQYESNQISIRGGI